jgi:hypothetical protein
MISYAFFEDSLFLAFLAYAFFKGDKDARVVSAILIAEWALSNSLPIIVPVLYTRAGVGLISVSTGAVVCPYLLYLALRRGPLWLLVSTGFQLAALFIDVAAEFRFTRWSFATLTYVNICAWMSIAALMTSFTSGKLRKAKGNLSPVTR